MGGGACVPRSLHSVKCYRSFMVAWEERILCHCFIVVRIPGVSLVKSIRLTDGVYYEGNIDDMLKGHYLDLANAGSARECQRLMFIYLFFVVQLSGIDSGIEGKGGMEKGGRRTEMFTGLIGT